MYTKEIDSRRYRRAIGWSVIVVSLLVLAALALPPVLAGPTQEKGEEQGKEKAEEEKEEKKVFTNQDLRKNSSSSSGSGESASAGDDGDPDETPAVAEDPWASVGVPTDSQGRGEEYWRQAMSDARGAVTAAKAEKDRLQSEMNRSRVDFTAIDDPAARAVVDTRIQELFGLLEEADQSVAAAEQALRDLEEDARRSGALPGWLR